MKGFFLTLDGIDGAGKSTHLAFIQQWIQKQGIEAIFTREPGGTPLGEELRNILLHTSNQIHPETEALMMFTARCELLNEVIIPALNKGCWVVSDRFSDATFAYQGGGRGVAWEKMEQLQQWVQNDLRPNMTIILDVPLEVSLERLERSREKDRFEQESPDFFIRVRQAYLKRAEDTQHYAVVRSDRDIEEVQADIEKILSGCLKQYQSL
ncbi:MAG: dTMP kinase [Neisseriaceae bacterium]|nr:dTMP kinase [Neisseriaceae bacterium]MBQ9619040.1 dTMP kinase [Neisseriaceae bacterium]